ncbi:adenylosuccinate lyase [Candidatus Woesearchaeota archaeon]|nr:adenylosuccinate lyase [Candidatus Woesearchaeota archaeon]
MANLNVLSDRYATDEMNSIWSDLEKTRRERRFWVEILKAEKQMGVDIPSPIIEAYESAIDVDNRDAIREMEAELRHDIKAKIQGFSGAAGVNGYIHRPLTSRDLTDNVEQWQIMDAAKLVFGKYVAILAAMDKKADAYANICLTARTHLQPAQLTLLGRRFSMWEEELLEHLAPFEDFIRDYPMRGIKGPVGTQFDLLTLLGSSDKVDQMEAMVAESLGFSRVLHSTGQVYPRSLDYSLLAHLSQVASSVENFANNMRLMASSELVTEGFKEGQVGSSAMPHKMNTRTSERVWGFAELLKMYADGGSRLSGAQLAEGDVSCSVVRRVILPDAFYASDGLCEAALTVFKEMGAYPAIISAEADRYLPFLATTEILNLAQTYGIDRETAHEVIKKHSIAAALGMRKSGTPPDLSSDLAVDPIFAGAGISKSVLENLLQDREHFVGLALQQIGMVHDFAVPFFERYPTQAAYQPKDIL